MPTSRKVVALIPAHNEQGNIGRAIEALHDQTRRPDTIIVLADNCSDGTEQVAHRHGAGVFVTRENTDKKAGALNQALDLLLPVLAPEDVILVQDADSFLDPGFIESGLKAYTSSVGGVGGVFRGRVESDSRWSRILEALQSNEYSRYELDIRRQRGKVLVLTGTATLLRVGILRDVVEARRLGILPGKPQVYDTKVLTEDNELSFALMHLGYEIRSPKGCTLSTETMPTLRMLASQRLRWKRGALENLFDYGWTKVTRGYWGRQVTGVLGVLITLAYFGSLIYGAVFGITLHPFWLGITALFALERAVTVRRRGPKQMLVAALLLIEGVYDMFLQCVQATAYVHAATGRERRW